MEEGKGVSVVRIVIGDYIKMIQMKARDALLHAGLLSMSLHVSCQGLAHRILH